jgi:nucleotide-binding universal stress UspA family protein
MAIAQTFDARLVGLGARAFIPMPDPIGLSAVKLKQEIEEDLTGAERLFEEEVGDLSIASRVWRTEVDLPTQVLLRHACGADLILADRNVEGKPRETQAGTADLIMCSGLPVLTVPAGAGLDFKKILIGWKNTREARRAVWDALPLLKRAENVRVVHVLRFASERVPEIADVVDRLRLHDVPVEAEVRNRTEGSVAEDLLAVAGAIGAGLIVVGGYGHSRLREWVLGGVTQGLLTHSPKPVLFSH